MAATPEDVEHSTPSPARGRLRSRASVLLIGLIASSFFFGPALVAAVHPASKIENRSLGKLPHRHDGWAAFGIFDIWATDHLPLRDQAIKANTALDRDIFNNTPAYGSNGQGTSPAPGLPGVAPAEHQGGASTPLATVSTVIGGTNGWLYYGLDFSNACAPVSPPTVTAQRLQRFADIMRSAGKTVVVFVAPDKSDIYPEHVPTRYVGKDCARKGQDAFWAALAAHPPTGYQDLHATILAAKEHAPDQLLYKKLDTHWNPVGALIYTKMLTDTIDPTLWPTGQVNFLGDQRTNAAPEPGFVATIRRQTDLATMLGTNGDESTPRITVTRPGVVTTTDSPVLLTNTTTGAPLINKTTVFISDSFTDAARFAISPFFQQASFFRPVAVATEFEQLTSSIRDAKIVVFEMVERDAIEGNAPILQEDALNRLASSLEVQ